MKIIKKIGVSKSSHLCLSKKLRKLFAKNTKEVTFSFGDWSEHVSLSFKKELTEDTIELPIGWKEKFMFPELPYEIKITGNTFKLGPVICFAPARTRAGLIKNLKYYERYFENFQHINGLLFLCATIDININNEIIYGFYYDLSRKVWEKGTFPIPDTLFRRAPINNEPYKYLENKLGKRLFNTPFLDKWQVWKLLSTNERLLGHIPHTKLLTKSHLDQMLQNYHEVHIKPLNGLMARGIYQITKRANLYEIFNQNGKIETLSEQEMFSFLKSKRKYIVQQSVKTDSKVNRNIVVRVILQKNKLEQWECTASYARIGKKGSIATNRLLTDTFSTVTNLFKLYYQLDDSNIFKKEQEMVSLCIDACQVLEKNGNYGDVAIDLMMDEQNKLWIIEINHRRHNHSSTLQTINDREMYDKVLRTPFEYAKSLAGFRE